MEVPRCWIEGVAGMMVVEPLLQRHSTSDFIRLLGKMSTPSHDKQGREDLDRRPDLRFSDDVKIEKETEED